MRPSRQHRLEIAAAERDLLVAKLNGLLGAAGVVEPDRPLSVEELISLADHVRKRFSAERLPSLARMLPTYRA